MNTCNQSATTYTNPLVEKPVDESGSVDTNLYIPLLNNLPHLYFEKDTECKTVKIDWTTALPPIKGVSQSIHRPL